MDLKDFISFSENDMPYWSRSKKPFDLIPDQIAFAAVVYFEQVFELCRLKSTKAC